MRSSHYWIYETLREGSSGTQTLQLQRSLPLWSQSQDFSCDGKFGGKTSQAVHSFQEAMGLTVDGIAGKRTISLLGVWCELEKGFDASHWQKIDWDILKKNKEFSFALFKATEGSSHLDPSFKENCEQASAMGLEVGAYHFGYFEKSPAEEAENFWDALNPYVSQVYLDLEKRDMDLRGDELGAWVIEFMDSLAALSGYSLSYGIYTSTNYLHEKDLQGIMNFRQYNLWSADWKNQPLTVPWQAWNLWQYTNKAQVEGIQGDVDLNWKSIH